MKAILVAIGSLGDVHPVLGIGAALKARGHMVEVLANSAFEGNVRRTGLPFHSIGDAAEHEEAMAKVGPSRRPISALPPYDYLYIQPMGKVYGLLKEMADPASTLVVSTFYSIGARLARERLGLPLVGLALSPGVFFSAIRPARYTFNEPPAWVPRWVYRGVFRILENRIDRVVGPACNRFRGELGLPPIRGVRRWLMSPDRLIGLFPAWYGPRQPDWPDGVELTGFPLFDDVRAESAPLQDGVEDFLAAGPPPVVFTQGTPSRQARTFFHAAVQAAGRTGVRAVLLTKYSGQVPEHLPPYVRRFDYLPFSRVLPRAAAFVHHGGIGSVAQALAAGVPQLIVPWGIDQFDNAARVEMLGVGGTLRLQTVSAAGLSEKLGALIGSPEVRRRCGEIASRIRESDPAADACRSIESLAKLRGLPA